MKTQTLKIATRKSPLALWQANYVKNALERIHPNLTVELLPLMSQGDKLLATPLSQIGGKGLFVKELETAIIERRADIAVHSVKDMPVDLPDSLVIATYCEREDPRDVFISNRYSSFNQLPPGAIIGTASLRRQCQLKALRPDILVHTLRGNVNTRLQKLDDDEYDAIILAAAGIIRLEKTERISEYFSVEQILPGIGQGSVCIETRSFDQTTMNLIAALDHEPTRIRITAERAMNERLDGGCQVPMAAYATLEGNQINVRGLVGSLDGRVMLRANQQGDATQAHELGIQLAEDLLSQGADKILAEVLGR